MKNISIDGKKVIKVQNGHISIAFPTGIEKTGKAIRKMLKLLVQAEKEEERKPHNKDQIYKADMFWIYYVLKRSIYRKYRYGTKRSFGYITWSC